MPDMSDYHAYSSTTGGSDSSSSGGSGCSWRVIIWIVVIVELLTLLGKCSG